MNAVIQAPTPLPAPVADTAGIIAAIERAASNPRINLDKMDRLLAMQERILTQHRESLFNAAMAAAQADMGRVSADAENTQTHSRYATYGAIDRVLRPIYTRHGFGISFDEADSPKPEHVRMIALVSHIGGYSRLYHRDIPADGKGAKGGDVMTKTHAVGSAQQYGMRYLIKGIFNVAIGDDPEDDGNGAGGSTVATITPSQVADLEALVSEHGGNRNKLLKFMKLRSFAEIPAQNFNYVCQEVRSLARDRERANARMR